MCWPASALAEHGAAENVLIELLLKCYKLLVVMAEAGVVVHCGCGAVQVVDPTGPADRVRPQASKPGLLRTARRCCVWMWGWVPEQHTVMSVLVRISHGVRVLG